jgi:hypothetical protein
MAKSGKDAQASFRLPQSLYDRLKAAAGDRPIGDEMRRRLEASFTEAPPGTDDPKTQALLAAIAEIASQLHGFYEPWHENAYSLAVLKSAVATLLTVMGPKGEPKLELNPEKHLLDAVFDVSDPPETVGRLMAMLQLTGSTKERP